MARRRFILHISNQYGSPFERADVPIPGEVPETILDNLKMDPPQLLPEDLHSALRSLRQLRAIPEHLQTIRLIQQGIILADAWIVLP